MIQLVSAIVCALLFVLTVAVRRVYYCVPAKELKRLAREQDRVGMQLYRAVAFDGSLAVLLWTLTGVFAAASFVLFALALPAGLAAFVVAMVLWFGFGWVASAFPRDFMIQFTTAISPAVAWTLGYAHIVLSRVSGVIRTHHRTFEHTGLYEKQDLVALLGRQKEQLDSRVAPDEISLIERVLAFSDKAVKDIVTPRKKVRLVRLGETIGPKLMDELHKSGQHLFPVTDDEGKQVVGLVRLEDLVKARHGGTIKSVADEGVHFVRDDFTLSHALEIFRKSKQQLLVVINNFEEFLGVLPLDSLLSEIMGEQGEASENIYTDRQAVANYEPPELPEPQAEQSNEFEPATPDNNASEAEAFSDAAGRAHASEVNNPAAQSDQPEADFAIVDERTQPATTTPDINESQEKTTSEPPVVVE